MGHSTAIQSHHTHNLQLLRSLSPNMTIQKIGNGRNEIVEWLAFTRPKHNNTKTRQQPQQNHGICTRTHPNTAIQKLGNSRNRIAESSHGTPQNFPMKKWLKNLVLLRRTRKDIVKMVYLPARSLIPNVVRGFQVDRGWSRGCYLGSGINRSMLVTHTPVAIWYNSPVFVPNGDSIGLLERLIDNDREAWGRTYTCSNINNDAATMEMEPKVYRKQRY